jgi:multimeric flavodoxin WrbA
MKKVLLLCGSPRKDGNTALLLKDCARVIEENGVKAEVISLAGESVSACIACGKCQETGECSIDDVVNKIIKKLKDGARGFIVGTPVYFGTARGDVMCALQRIGMVSNRSLRDNPERLQVLPIRTRIHRGRGCKTPPLST